jgi:anthranilate phosphoribosyltransferase
MNGGVLNEALGLLAERRDLPADAMHRAMRAIMRGEAGDVELAAFLAALRVKGETAEELAAAVEVLRESMFRLDTGGVDVLDTCGTGGDGQHSFNISTAAALVVAGCGVPVVKHGNRGVSSSSGSADVLAALGVKIDAEPAVAERCLQETGFAFCFAPRFHPAMRHVAEVRKRLRFRTIFNLMGPLCNPAGARHQLVGVGRPELLDVMAECLCRLGADSAIVVHSADGLDEVSLTGITLSRRVQGGQVGRPKEWSAASFGLPPCTIQDLRVEGPGQSAQRIREVLAGQPGPARDVVMANAAVAYQAFRWETAFGQALTFVKEALDSGRARSVLERLIVVSQS